jgi:hypothetical protein
MSFKECLDVVLQLSSGSQNVERPDGHPLPGRPICIYHKELKEVLFQLPPAPKAGWCGTVGKGRYTVGTVDICRPVD